MVPQTRYTRSGDASIAYQVCGDNGPDVLFVTGWIAQIEHLWEAPANRRFLERLAAFTRLILFDKRGMGMSDRVPGATTLEQRMDDVRAVMDAAGSERAAATRATWSLALATEMCGSRPDAEVVTASTGTAIVESRLLNVRYAATRAGTVSA